MRTTRIGHGGQGRRRKNGRVRSRIDWFLVSGDWESYFSRVIQSTLLSFGGLKDILKA